MKKDRNCGMPPYPIYQGAPGMMPGAAPGMMPGMMPGATPEMMPGMMPGMAPGNVGYGTPGYPQPTYSTQMGPTQQPGLGTSQQEIASINRRIDNLERRLSAIESAMGSQMTPYNNNFNDSNYQMI